MLLKTNASLHEISSQGKLYQWQKPKQCPRCHNPRLWGHGFVLRVFQELLEAVFLKRWRCPRCCCILSVKPSGFDQGYVRTKRETIASEIHHRLIHKKWHQAPRQRAGYWLHMFLTTLTIHFPESREEPVSTLLNWLAKGIPLWSLNQNIVT